MCLFTNRKRKTVIRFAKSHSYKVISIIYRSIKRLHFQLLSYPFDFYLVFLIRDARILPDHLMRKQLPVMQAENPVEPGITNQIYKNKQSPGVLF